MAFEKYYDEPELVTLPPCVHLRSKAMFTTGQLINPDHPDESGSHYCWCNMTQHIIGPDKKVKLTLTYPASTGRNFDEILRIIDSLQLTADHSLATPANWQPGEDWQVSVGLDNVLDERYRVHGSGIDAPGRNLSLAVRRNW